MKTPRHLLLTAAAALAFASSASATLLFYEDFSGSNFVVGNSVNGTLSNSSGALGQNGTWVIRSGATVNDVVSSSALTYTNGSVNMSGSGKAVSVTPTVNNQSVIFGVNPEMSTWGNVASPSEVGNGNSLYFSILWRVETGSSLAFDSTRLGLLNSTGGITGTGTTGYQLGTNNTPQFGSYPGNNTFTLPGSPTAPSAGTTYLLVGRFGSNGTAFTTFDVWINPATLDGSDTPCQSYTGLTSAAGITAW